MIESLRNNLVFFMAVMAFLLLGCSGENTINTPTTHTIQETHDCIKIVKYRSYGSVDVCTEKFIKLKNIGDKTVFGAWYDKDNQYMLIQLKNTNYHYCGISLSDWEGIENILDTDQYYIDRIKGRYDCRSGIVPKY